jgi:hypothetical protein
MGEYVPQAPINDDAKKANRNLAGMGGVFNVVNLHVYHYAGNNPVKYTDPDGRDDFDWMMEMFEDEMAGIPWTQADVMNAELYEMERQTNVIIRNLPYVMAKSAGMGLLSGAQFISKNGSRIALACYISGHVEIGVVVDGLVVVSRISLNIYDYVQNKDVSTGKVLGTILKEVATYAGGQITGGMIKSHILSKYAYLNISEPTLELLSNRLAAMYNDVLDKHFDSSRIINPEL